MRVEIDDPGPRYKDFRGVWLVEGKQRRVVSYRSNALWEPFEGREVVVTGAVYTPEGQAISATHYRVESLEVTDGEGAWRGFGPQQLIPGRIETASGEPGSKREGESWVVVVGTRTWQVINPDAVHLEGKVDVRGREMLPSPTAAHDGGPFLFVETATLAK